MLKYLLNHQHHTSEWPTELKVVAEVAHQTILQISPLGGYVAAGADDGSLLIFDADTWSVVFRYKYHAMPLNGISWSEDSTYLISVGTDWQVVLWKMSERRILKSFDLDFNPICVSFNYEKWNMLVVTSLKTLYIMTLDPHSELLSSKELGSVTEGHITSVQFLKTGMVCCGTSNGKLHMFTPEGNLIKIVSISDDAIINFTFCHFANVLGVSCGDKSVRVFYLEEFVDDYSKSEIGHVFANTALNDHWADLTISRDGDYLYAASTRNTGTVCLWHTFAKVEISVINDSSEPLKNLIFEPSRIMLMAVGKNTGKVYVWRTEPLRSWEKIMYKFTEINKLESYEGKESDWDVPDLEGNVTDPKPIDVWTKTVHEVIIPYKI